MASDHRRDSQTCRLGGGERERSQLRGGEARGFLSALTSTMACVLHVIAQGLFSCLRVARWSRCEFLPDNSIR